MIKNFFFALVLIVAGFIATPATAQDNQAPIEIAIIDSGVEKGEHLKPLMGLSYDMRISRKDKKIKSDHGTLIASIIADNVNRPIKIHSFRADISCKRNQPCKLDAGAIAVAIRTATKMKVKLIQISIDGDLGEKAIAAIAYATSEGVHVILSAGNDGMRSETADAASGLGSFVTVVGALDEDGNRADFSSQSRQEDVTLVMRPGVNVKARDAKGRVKLATGTSFAAPLYAAEVINAMP